MRSPIALLYDYVSSQFAKILPASTAAVATDPALVVAVSPNNTVGVATPDKVTAGTLTTLGGTVGHTLSGHAATAVQITGTWAGQVTFEATTDGVNYVPIYGLVAGESVIYTAIDERFNDKIYRHTTAGFVAYRVRATRNWSGTANVTIVSGVGTSGVYVNFPLPAGENEIGKVGATLLDLNGDRMSLATLVSTQHRMLDELQKIRMLLEVLTDEEGEVES